MKLDMLAYIAVPRKNNTEKPSVFINEINNNNIALHGDNKTIN